MMVINIWMMHNKCFGTLYLLAQWSMKNTHKHTVKGIYFMEEIYLDSSMTQYPLFNILNSVFGFIGK